MTANESLADRALDANASMLALGCEVFETEDARFVRNRDVPNRWDSNHVSRIRAATPNAIDRLVARARQEFEAPGMLSFEVDYRTPPEFEARLVQEGFEGDDGLVMVLEGELIGGAKPCEIRLVDGDDAWAEYGKLHAIDWKSYREKSDGEDQSSEDQSSLEGEMLRATRMKAPPARFWMAYVDGHARSYLFSWEGLDGVGQVEALFTHPDFRHRGLATALIHHCVADVRARGAGPVVILADAADTPKEMYAAMGFRPVAVKRRYRKRM